MKKTNQINNGKLQLKKQAIANLSKPEQTMINGGKEDAAAWTTSIGKCSGFMCCGHTDTCTWVQEVTKIAVGAALSAL